MKIAYLMRKTGWRAVLTFNALAISTLVACGGNDVAASRASDSGAGVAVTSGSGSSESGASSSGASGSGGASDTGDSSSNSPGPKSNAWPAFDLNGFTYCDKPGVISKQDETLNLKTKTHVAFGLQSDKRLVYLFNQIGSVTLNEQVFGSFPVPGKYAQGYCKVVTADNNDAQVFMAALTALKSHLEGSPILVGAQLQEINERLKQTMYVVTQDKNTLTLAFSVIGAYEKMRGGALFANAATKGGFPNEYYGDTKTDIDRSVLTIQQSIHDNAFTPGMFIKYKELLTGKKFNSSDWFPGKVKKSADSTKVYPVRINATMVKDVDIRTAFSADGRVARRPTGYYLAAGDVAKVTVPSSMVNANFAIQVGANLHDKYIKSTIMRPFRVTTKFPIVSTVTEIANPNGGGIYIDVPYLATAGKDVTIEIQNAVPAPFFSSIAFNETTLQQWKDVQRNNPAPWADFVSEKFMMTLPTAWIYNYADPVSLMKDWDNRMDIVSDYVGRSKVRNNQILYLTVDTSLLGNAFGIGYPTGNNTYEPGQPTDGNSKNWYLRTDKDFSEVEFHELGHAQLFSDFPGEGEASINILSVAVSNKLYGVDIDKALSKSINNTPQLIGRDQAAVGWMVRQNFRDGKAMGIGNNGDAHEVMYVQRGYAKYVEIAALFGWDKLEKFYAEENRVFRKEAVAAGAGLESVDSRILRMSIAAGVDLTPLIHFWGVQPVKADALSSAIAAAGLKPSALIYDRLARYEAMIPVTNAAFQAHAVEVLNKPAAMLKLNGDNNNTYGEGWYKVWIDKYGPAEGQAAKSAFANMLARYFPKGRPA